MGSPAEPLLPVEPDPPSKRKLWLALGAGILVVAAAGAFVALRRPAPEESPVAADPGAARPAKPEPGRKTADVPRSDDPDEREARELYEGADAFERSQPGDYEKRMARWREVVTKHP